jgi:hypothetical protein
MIILNLKMTLCIHLWDSSFLKVQSSTWNNFPSCWNSFEFIVVQLCWWQIASAFIYLKMFLFHLNLPKNSKCRILGRSFCYWTLRHQSNFSQPLLFLEKILL